MTLSVRSIRSIATRHNYTEIGCNETSRVISFQGGRNGSTRINVYYTTGTVGTCINHPHRGKSQLFRRNQSLDDIEAIFANPRVHTGEGYYTRESISQCWKNGNELVRDSARRWALLGSGTGLVKNEREARTIAEICTTWDDLHWYRDEIPNLEETHFKCGSRGALMIMLCEVVRETVGEFRVCHFTDSEKYQNGEISKHEVNDEMPHNHQCRNLVPFLQDHQDDVRYIKIKFMSLRKAIRIELAQWFLGRDDAGKRFTDIDFLVIKTPYSQALTDAHIEYGESMYPKTQYMFNHCGVI